MINPHRICLASVLAMLLALSVPPRGEAAGRGQPPRVRPEFPEFSWDCVPRYMHVRKSTAFTEAEIRYLASFPLITFEKTTGAREFGSTEAGTLAAARAVKALNPAAKILYYRNVIVHYESYAADAALDAIPGAFLADGEGNDRLVRGRVQAYDLTNPAVRDWWLDAAHGVAADPAIDGLFIDGNVKVLEPAYLRREIGDAKKDALEAGYDALMDNLRRRLGADGLILANVIRARFPDAALGRMGAFDGSYIEGLETAVGGIARKDYVARGLSAIQDAARRGALIAFTAGLGGEAGQETNAHRTDEVRARAAEWDEALRGRFTYLLAMFLVCAEKHSYFLAHDSYDAEASGIWMNDPPELSRPLGPPRGPARRSGYVYTRDFAHAKVRVDIEAEIGDIKWISTDR